MVSSMFHVHFAAIDLHETPNRHQTKRLTCDSAGNQCSYHICSRHKNTPAPRYDDIQLQSHMSAYIDDTVCCPHVQVYVYT